MPAVSQLKFNGNLKWARMKMKPSKCRSISISKGNLEEDSGVIRSVVEKPVKSLGRWYNCTELESRVWARTR